MDTEQVLSHHLEAFAAGDVDAVMEDYTQDSIVMVPDTTCRGLDEIRGMFEMLFKGPFLPDSYEFEMDRVEIDGEIAYIVWHAGSEMLDVPLGPDTFVVRDGKIAVQTFAGHIVSKF